MVKIPHAAIILSEHNIPYRLFHHQTTIESLAQAANERGQTIEQVVRSILFRVSNEIFVLVLIAGPSQISWSKLRTYLGQSRLSLATHAEVLEKTGYRVGTVSPLGLRDPIRILADHNVFYPEEISIGSGLSGTAIIIKSAELKNIFQSIEIGDFSSQLPEHQQ